jgi:excisionase family DNA binding protein
MTEWGGATVELTSEQVAARLGVTESRIRQLVIAGRLTPSRTVGKGYLFDEAAIDAFATLPRSRTGRPRKQKGNDGNTS